ncbi:uncharacterized protein LOC135141671 [Zophobas morio]|uniref:uncharacterized protein LOC135141671 n=1 Tax=Zophobas morio TaxID=2755281 RepID=UPI003082B6A0
MVVGALGRLIPNVGGPRASKRRVVCSVVHGILLFGEKGWIAGYRIQKYLQMLLGIHRNMLLQVCCAYRTVSWKALCVLAGIPPLDLLAEKHLPEWKRRKNKRLRKSSSTTGILQGSVLNPLLSTWETKKTGKIEERTVSAANQAVVGIPPNDLLVRERGIQLYLVLKIL